MRFKALPGFRDFYPEEMALRRWIESAWHDAARASGYEEWDGPVLEALELFTEKSGAEIAGQLFAFEDKGGRDVALRPEMTPTLARMVGARAGGLPKPLKWYCVPQFFRYEKPQRGRSREFLQWNVDVIGAADAAADAEVMAVALAALRALGLGPADLVLRVNDRRFVRRMLASIDVSEQQERDTLACIDRLERDPTAGKQLAELLGAERAREIEAWCERVPLERADELAPLLEACEDFDLGSYVEADFRIVRGLAYYTGPVWEIFDRGRKLRAVAGGGRYDALIGAFGGPDLPALGFGMGDVVLGELLRQRGIVPPEVPRVEAFVVPIGAEMIRPARRVLARLRQRGVSADGPYASLKLAKGLRAAVAAGARRAILVGPEEWSEGEVRVRDLSSGEERRVRLENLE